MNITRNEVLKCLTECVCLIAFDKKDGSKRRMTCTLKPDVVNQISDGKVYESKDNNNTNQIRVIDTDLMAWRSFLLDHLTEFEAIVL